MSLTKPLISALPPLKPEMVIDVTTGQVLTQMEYNSPVGALLTYCQSETQRIYAENTSQLLADIVSYRSNANSFGRQKGYASNVKALDKTIKAKSRINELILHKLISEAASYVKNTNEYKQPPSFPVTINLGAVNAQMAKLSLDGDELTMLWKCWDKELLFIFKLPAYILKRNLSKVSLPLVKLDKNNFPVFLFTVQEAVSLRPASDMRAGVDLGQREPYVLAITNQKGKRVAHYKASSRLNRLTTKQNRLRSERSAIYKKIAAYDSLSLDSTVLEAHKGFVSTACTRLTKEIALQLAAELTLKLEKHPVHLLNVEDLSWVSGTKNAKIGTSRWAHSQQQEAITHAALRKGITVKTVNPKNTSQTCSKCGGTITHTSKRTVWCSECKITLDRDLNASLNIANDINKKKRFPIIHGNNGSDSSFKQVMIVKSDSVPKKLIPITRIIT